MLAVIPARGGSKRLPGKNIRPLAGLPLIAWTIRTAIASGIFDEVLVSTDAPDVAEISARHGAAVPWLRPPELATDTATSVDVVLHAVSACEAAGQTVASVMLLQPTSPFRSVATIRRAVELHDASGKAPVVSVCLAQAHPAWCFQLEDDGCLRGYVNGSPFPSRSQELPPAYQLNGAVYLASVADLRRDKSFFGPRTRALLMAQPDESLDIDDAWDWQLAECIVRGRPVPEEPI